NASGDWPIRSAIFTRSSRLGIVRFQVARAAMAPDHDESVPPATRGTRASSQPEQIGEAQASESSQTQAQKRAPVHRAGARKDRETSFHSIAPLPLRTENVRSIRLVFP